MKRTVSLILGLIATMGLTAQVPQGFNYQALVQDASGAPIANTSLPVAITLQTDSLGGTVLWEELHSSVTTNSYGVVNLVVGRGIRQATSTVENFSDIDWTTTPVFIQIHVFYNSTLINMGSNRLWSVPYSTVAGALAGPVEKIEVKGTTTSLEEPLFEVKNKEGQTVFAVYNEGVRVYVADGAKGTKGGFAIGSIGTEKAASQPFLVVNPDSIRAYVQENTGKGTKGGFAIGGYSPDKSGIQDLFVISPDSIRAYINTESMVKGSKGGFAIGGYDLAKGIINDFVTINPDSINFYIGASGQNPSSTFNIIGIGADQRKKRLLTANTDTIAVESVLNVQSNIIVSGNINLAGTVDPAVVKDIDGNSYKTIRIGTQLWMAENLKTTKFNDGTVIPKVTDSTAWASSYTAAYCDYNNDTANSVIYGKLYNWYAASTWYSYSNVCPVGWHVPTEEEWTTMETYLIDNGYNYDGTTGNNLIAKSLASSSNWTFSGITGAPGNTDYSAMRNRTGFTGLPGGKRLVTGFFDLGNSGYWWSSDLYIEVDAWYTRINHDNPAMLSLSDYQSTGMSIRCIKDSVPVGQLPVGK